MASFFFSVTIDILCAYFPCHFGYRTNQYNLGNVNRLAYKMFGLNPINPHNLLVQRATFIIYFLFIFFF